MKRTTVGMRHTLVQQQSMVGVNDPSAHAKRQVAELDKTAKKSGERRKLCNEQMTQDMKELVQLDEQIKSVHRSYDPLCEQLEENIKRRKELVETLESCRKQENRVMSEMKLTVTSRNQEDTRFSRKMVTQKLEIIRGYSIDSSSTFKQTMRR